MNGTPENVRNNAREAVRLFKEAGYEIRGGKMVNIETGEPFTIELVENSPTMERVVLPVPAEPRGASASSSTFGSSTPRSTSTGCATSTSR